MSMLCTACGKNDTPPIEGTWYSVTDASMYNFKDGEITLSGVTVGQYEDAGDSVVISMIDDGTNIQLYTTKMGGRDVLATVKEGDGLIYFCKGLENAQAIIAEQEAAKQKIIQDFVEYAKNNLVGVWVSDGPGPLYDKIEFFEDGTIERTLTSGEVEKKKVITDSYGNATYNTKLEEYYSSDGSSIHPTITINISDNGTRYGSRELFFYSTDKTYTDNQIRIYGWSYTKQK